jgi:hypothetical protein
LFVSIGISATMGLICSTSAHTATRPAAAVHQGERQSRRLPQSRVPSSCSHAPWLSSAASRDVRRILPRSLCSLLASCGHGGDRHHFLRKASER